MVKPFAWVLLLVAIYACGCSLHLLPADRKALDAMLAPDYVVPASQREEAYAVLRAFKEHRRVNEYVYRIQFDPLSTSVSFTDGGMHGGGVALFRKENGRWVMSEKIHFE